MTRQGKRCQRGKGVRNVSATVYSFVAGWLGFQVVPSRSMALRITRSLRIAAVSASFVALPLARRRW